MLDTLLFDKWEQLLRAFLMCLLAYPFLILVLRVFGKREITKINLFDFIITVTYGATLSSILTSDSVSFAEGAVVLTMLALLQFLVAKLSVKSKRFADFLKASPTLLYYDGEFREKEMDRQRIRREDLYGKVRKQGMSPLDKVEAIVFEGDGSLSIIKKEEGSSKEALKGVEGLKDKL